MAAAAAPARRWAPTSLWLILFVLASHLPSDRSAASAKLVVGSLKTGENWAFVSRFCFLSLHGRFQALGSNEPPLVQAPLCSGLKPSLEPLVHLVGAEVIVQEVSLSSIRHQEAVSEMRGRGGH